MSKKVFANNLEITGKASSNMTIAAMPDVCLTPPPPPAGPIPIPYPDTSKSADLKDGSKDVSIGGKPVCKGSKSHYKSAPLGDEACTKAHGMNIIDHANGGKTFCQGFSMDVSIEGEPATRTGDVTTSNHQAAAPPATPAIPQVGEVGTGGRDKEIKCECCGNDPHSAAQARGVTISQDDYYKPTQTGLRKRSAKGGKFVMEPNKLNKNQLKMVDECSAFLDKVRDSDCKDQLPPEEPDDDPCNRYYKITSAEKKEIEDEYEALNNSSNSDRPARWADPDCLMVAHRVPKSAGGCPVGEGNTPCVTTAECKKMDHELGTHQGNMFNLIKDQT